MRAHIQSFPETICRAFLFKGGAFLNSVSKHKTPIVANNLGRKDFVAHVPNLCTFPAIFN